MIKNIIIIILAIICIIFFVDYKNNNKDVGFLPGDIFYSLDQAWEWTQENLLTYSEDKKLKLKISFLEERLSELEELKNKKDTTKEKINEVLNKYNLLMDDINYKIEKTKEINKDTSEFLNKIKEISDRQKNILNDISDFYNK